MMDQTIIIIDTETGGLDAENHSLLTVSMIATRGRLFLKAADWKVKHRGYHVTPQALEINGIDLVTHDKEATEAYQVASGICQFIEEVRKDPSEKVVFLGQNTAFDMAFLERFMQSCYGLSLFKKLVSHRKLDLMNMTAFLNLSGLLKTDGLGLDDVVKALGIKVPERHTAYGDAWATLEALNHMLRLLDKAKA